MAKTDNAIPEGLHELPAELDALHTRLDTLHARLDTIEQRLDAFTIPEGLHELPVELDTLRGQMDTAEQRLDALERSSGGARSGRAGVDVPTPTQGEPSSGVGYHIDRINAVLRKWFYGDMLDYDRNAHFLAGNVTSGQPENIGPNPPPRDEQPGPVPVDPRVSVRGDQATDKGVDAGALDASRPTV